MDISPYLGSIVTVIIAFGCFYGAVNARLARTEQKVDDLKDQVERHNQVMERTFRLEENMDTAYRRIDKLEKSDIRLEDKIDTLKVGGTE